MDKRSKLRKAVPYILCVAGLLLGGLIGWVARNRFYLDQTFTHWDTAAVILCVIIAICFVWTIVKLLKRKGD
jgi:uncharacterized membrane protein YoaK (UPF0700 family)